ncbi:hypothetical protein FQN57_000804 [Myotisia sp. PD_48]|nr:hypothetical protein FQN57_000804 [Myotisia sp. PD_48]
MSLEARMFPNELTSGKADFQNMQASTEFSGIVSHFQNRSISPRSVSRTPSSKYRDPSTNRYVEQTLPQTEHTAEEHAEKYQENDEDAQAVIDSQPKPTQKQDTNRDEVRPDDQRSISSEICVSPSWSRAAEKKRQKKDLKRQEREQKELEKRLKIDAEREQKELDRKLKIEAEREQRESEQKLKSEKKQPEKRLTAEADKHERNATRKRGRKLTKPPPTTVRSSRASSISSYMPRLSSSSSIRSFWSTRTSQTDSTQDPERRSRKQKIFDSLRGDKRDSGWRWSKRGGSRTPKDQTNGNRPPDCESLASNIPTHSLHTVKKHQNLRAVAARTDVRSLKFEKPQVSPRGHADSHTSHTGSTTHPEYGKENFANPLPNGKAHGLGITPSPVSKPSGRISSTAEEPSSKPRYFGHSPYRPQSDLLQSRSPKGSPSPTTHPWYTPPENQGAWGSLNDSVESSGKLSNSVLETLGVPTDHSTKALSNRNREEKSGERDTPADIERNDRRRPPVPVRLRPTTIAGPSYEDQIKVVGLKNILRAQIEPELSSTSQAEPSREASSPTSIASPVPSPKPKSNGKQKGGRNRSGTMSRESQSQPSPLSSPPLIVQDPGFSIRAQNAIAGGTPEHHQHPPSGDRRPAKLRRQSHQAPHQQSSVPPDIPKFSVDRQNKNVPSKKPSVNGVPKPKMRPQYDSGHVDIPSPLNIPKLLPPLPSGETKPPSVDKEKSVIAPEESTQAEVNEQQQNTKAEEDAKQPRRRRNSLDIVQRWRSLGKSEAKLRKRRQTTTVEVSSTATTTNKPGSSVAASTRPQTISTSRRPSNETKLPSRLSMLKNMSNDDGASDYFARPVGKPWLGTNRVTSSSSLLNPAVGAANNTPQSPRPSNSSQRIGKLFVICCECKFWHDMPSEAYAKLVSATTPSALNPNNQRPSDGVGKISAERLRPFVERDAITTGRSVTDNNSTTAIPTTPTTTKLPPLSNSSPRWSFATQSAINCCWCGHGMSRSCCAGWTAVVQLRERHH